MDTFKVLTVCPHCKEQVEVEVPIHNMETAVRVYKSMTRKEQVVCPTKACGQPFEITIE